MARSAAEALAAPLAGVAEEGAEEEGAGGGWSHEAFRPKVVMAFQNHVHHPLLQSSTHGGTVDGSLGGKHACTRIYGCAVWMTGTSQGSCSCIPWPSDHNTSTASMLRLRVPMCLPASPTPSVGHAACRCSRCAHHSTTRHQHAYHHQHHCCYCRVHILLAAAAGPSRAACPVPAGWQVLRRHTHTRQGCALQCEVQLDSYGPGPSVHACMFGAATAGTCLTSCDGLTAQAMRRIHLTCAIICVFI